MFDLLLKVIRRRSNLFTVATGTTFITRSFANGTSNVIAKVISSPRTGYVVVLF
jgi:hypothetical protein